MDNARLGILEKSDQFDQVEDFVRDNMQEGQVYVTGHSKGGANAAYACAVIDGVTGKKRAG